MALREESAALLDEARQIRQGLEALDVPERQAMLSTLKRLRDLLEAVRARAAGEESAAKRGIGAPARYGRLR
jgi:hypothetical protein